MDGFTGHTYMELHEYYLAFDIIIIRFPPHSTHLLQPLDVGEFQFLKQAQQRHIRQRLHHGHISFSRRDFIESFQDMFNQGFTKHHIILGFKQAGIYPTDPRPVLRRLAQKQRKDTKNVDPALLELLPRGERAPLLKTA